MSDHIDGWPPAKNRIASVAHIHAFGQVTLAYNLLEEWFGILFSTCMPMDEEASTRFFHELNNRTRVDLLRETIKSTENDSLLLDALCYAINCYDICTENRNTLMHLITDEIDTKPEAILKLSKRAAKNALNDVNFHISLEVLRQVADETVDIISFVAFLHRYILDRKNPAFHNMIRKVQGAASTPLALPERPQKPRRLTPYQPPEAPSSDSSPLPTSQG